MRRMRALTRKKAAWVVVLSVLFVSGPLYCLFGVHCFYKKHFLGSERYLIRTVVQTSEHYEAVKTAFLTEALQLSVDKPQNLYAFDVREGEERLLATHVIKKAMIRKIRPATLLVDYEIRKAVAYSGDVSNTLVDEEGVLFPAFPFFTPKRLPQLVFGHGVRWGERVSQEAFPLALMLMKALKCDSIDLSAMHSPMLGQREVVVICKNSHGALRTLRLPPTHLQEQLTRYLAFEERVLHKCRTNCVIDLRLPPFAYMSKASN